MARIRTIKPEFWSDERLCRELTRDQRMFYAGLWNEADDEGRFVDNARKLLGAVFPFDDDLTESFIEASLSRLADTGRLVRYEVAGCRYGQLVKFREHQRINRPSESRIPAPPNDLTPLTEPSLSPHGTVTEASPWEQGTGNREVEQGTGKETTAPASPTRNVENSVKHPTYTLNALAELARVRLGLGRISRADDERNKRLLRDWYYAGSGKRDSQDIHDAIEGLADMRDNDLVGWESATPGTPMLLTALVKSSTLDHTGDGAVRFMWDVAIEHHRRNGTVQRTFTKGGTMQRLEIEHEARP